MGEWYKAELFSINKVYKNELIHNDLNTHNPWLACYIFYIKPIYLFTYLLFSTLK